MINKDTVIIITIMITIIIIIQIKLSALFLQILQCIAVHLLSKQLWLIAVLPTFPIPIAADASKESYEDRDQKQKKREAW